MTTAEKNAETRHFVMSYLDFKGENRNDLTTDEAWEVFCLGDGFGNCTPEQLQQINSGWDWSHIRDSSDEAFLRMAMRIKAIVSRKAQWHAGIQKARLRVQAAAKIRNSFTDFLDNPSAANFTAHVQAMVEYQDLLKNQDDG